MPISYFPANRHTVVATGWTSASNAQSLARDRNYASLVSAKNATRSGDFGFADVPSSGSAGGGSTPPGGWDNFTAGQHGTSDIVDVAASATHYAAITADGTLRYATAPNQAAWDVHAATFTGAKHLAFINGYWLLSATAGLYYLNGSNPAGSWTLNSSTANVQFATWGAGTWAIFTTGGTRVLYQTASEPSGAWTENTNDLPGTLTWLEHGNGYWAACGFQFAAYRATDLAGAFTNNTPSGSTGITYQSIAYSSGLAQWGIASGNATQGVFYQGGGTPTGAWSQNAAAGLTGPMTFTHPVWTAVKSPTTITWAFSLADAFEDTSLSSPSTTKVIIGSPPSGTNYYVVGGPLGNISFATAFVEYGPGIPDGATINQVRARATWYMSGIVTGGLLGLQPRVNNANSGTEATDTTTAPSDTFADFGTVTVGQLRTAQSADAIEVRVRVTKGSTNSAMTGFLDRVFLQVDWTPPAGVDEPPAYIGGGYY